MASRVASTDPSDLRSDRKRAWARPSKTEATISDRFVAQVCDRLSQNKRVRRSLPQWGRLHIDRQLPFLCVYRRPTKRRDPETERLITSEASYLLALGNAETEESLSTLIKGITSTLVPIFGSFLILEIWCAWRTGHHAPKSAASPDPYFRILAPDTRGLSSTIETLQRTLRSVTIQGKKAVVETNYSVQARPPGRRVLLERSELEDLGGHLIGLEIAPIYRDRKRYQIFPLILRTLERQLTRALKQTFFQFARAQTKQFPLHYQALGPRAMVKAVWDVDRQLAEIGNSFDFLLALSPVNSHQAWIEFEKDNYQRAPEFFYRPIPIDPGLSKRALFQIPIERIEDPVLAHLFREKQEELDRQISMLSERHRPQFLHGSLQVFGGVDNRMLVTATDLLNTLPTQSSKNGNERKVAARAFAAHAEAEIEHYRRALPELSARVEVRKDITGLMVSRGSVLIGEEIQVPASRVHALLQHEVGTHLLTYINGKAQPFKQLSSGLAGYEELQEGLAVLAEHLVGGLTANRLRFLAGRVLAVRALTEGASFVETFRTLKDEHGFGDYAAFSITTRVFRGGGLTKDAIYLHGLVKVIEYLKDGGLLEPLFVGKIGLEHIPLIEELRWRKVLKESPLRPRFLDEPAASDRLKHLRGGLSLNDLVKEAR
ncbi:MAG: flavohemoglobin expression-modulating QEGLA motif protein [Kiloniellales bacterium]|nr:flavohemoglobin expression-modulating QEGLA motif protein [Kiloniellales bacterium]